MSGNQLVRFAPVRRRAQRSGNCSVCGKRTTRGRVFEQTLNPFNLNANGAVKSRAEIHEELAVEAEAWVPDFRHGACIEAVDE